MDRKFVVNTNVLAFILGKPHEYVLGLLDDLDCASDVLLSGAVPFCDELPDQWGYNLTMDMLILILDKFDEGDDE
jgi:hypothetical protein